MIKFVSYDGAYPCLCSGTLVVDVDGQTFALNSPLSSGGSVWFEDWNEHVSHGEWSVNLPNELFRYKEEITRLVNENVPFGCCGGCI